MRFLPIVERELRVAARRWGTFGLRTWVAMTVIAISAWIVLVNLEEKPSDVAGYLFYTVTAGALLYCLLIGLSATADSLSEEKREGTLGLLFLTDLKGWDVVAGKLVANSLNYFYGLLAIIPVMGLPLLLGGITAGQFGSAALSLVNAMFFSVSAGMLASACCRSRRKAVLLTFAIIMAIAVALPSVAMWRARAGAGLPLDGLAFLCSPVTCFFAPHDLGGLWAKDWRVFIGSAVTVQLEGWSFLLLACLVVPRSWQDRPAGAARSRWVERWRLWSHGDAGARKAFRARMLDANAFFWLAARDRLKPLWVWVWLAGVSGVWVWGYGKYRHEWFNEVVFIFTALVLNSVLKVWLASEAVRSLAEERRVGSLELLLVTSLTPRDILRGQAMALRRHFFWPVFVVVGAEFAMMSAGTLHALDSADRLIWLSWWSAGLIAVVADLVALYWVGMWMGLASPGPKRAYVDTIGRVLALPWVVFALFLAFMALVSVRGSSPPGWKFFLGCWFGLGLAVDLGFGLWARKKLLTEFRESATLRFQKRAAWWQRLFGKADPR